MAEKHTNTSPLVALSNRVDISNKFISVINRTPTNANKQEEYSTTLLLFFLLFKTSSSTGTMIVVNCTYVGDKVSEVRM